MPEPGDVNFSKKWVDLIDDSIRSIDDFTYKWVFNFLQYASALRKSRQLQGMVDELVTEISCGLGVIRTDKIRDFAQILHRLVGDDDFEIHFLT